ncbi:sugar ABC transporter ATP-binding protein, partial [Streptomyces sp. NPDC001100]
AGGTELAALKHELSQVRGIDIEKLPGGKDVTAPAGSAH